MSLIRRSFCAKDDVGKKADRQKTAETMVS
jgi:hypothetical protein